MIFCRTPNDLGGHQHAERRGTYTRIDAAATLLAVWSAFGSSSANCGPVGETRSGTLCDLGLSVILRAGIRGVDLSVSRVSKHVRASITQVARAPSVKRVMAEHNAAPGV